MPETSNNQQARLKKVLTGLFVLALTMGAGPGLYLVNPAAERGATVAGLPMLYAWAAGWLFVLVGIVLVAYFRVWSREEEPV